MELALHVPTPDAWLNLAARSLGVLLSDHAECEKKAAIAAINFTRYFTRHKHVLLSLARLAREEMRHYDLVLHWLESYGEPYKPTASCRYPSSLHSFVSNDKDIQVVDKLLVSSLIEARSCESLSRIRSSFYG